MTIHFPEERRLERISVPFQMIYETQASDASILHQVEVPKHAREFATLLRGAIVEHRLMDLVQMAHEREFPAAHCSQALIPASLNNAEKFLVEAVAAAP